MHFIVPTTSESAKETKVGVKASAITCLAALYEAIPSLFMAQVALGKDGETGWANICFF